MPGEAVSRGPRESNSTCARFGSCELSFSIAQMRRRTGSSTAKPVGWPKPWALAAVVVMAARTIVAGKTRRTVNGGDLLVILSMAMWSTYTICLRWRPAGLHMLSFLFVLMVVGDLCVLPFFAGELAFGRRMT